MNTRKKDKTLKRITVSIDQDDYSRMELLARNSGLSTALLIRQAMRDFIEKHENSEAISIALSN